MKMTVGVFVLDLEMICQNSCLLSYSFNGHLDFDSTKENMSGVIDHRSSNYGHGIVSQNCFAKVYSDAGMDIKAVQTGTFVQVHSIRDDDVVFCIVRDDMEVEMNQMVCKRADIINVPENLWRPLFTVEKMARLSLVKDSKVAESIGNISVGHTVQVLGPDGSVLCLANVTFRNSIGRLGVGVYFGLKVLNSKENLQTIVEKVSLLGPGTKGFPRGCDIVVTVDKILPNHYSFGKEKSNCYYDKEYKKQGVKGFSNGEGVNDGSHMALATYNQKDKQSSSCKKDERDRRTDSETGSSNLRVNKTVNQEPPLQLGEEVVYLRGVVPEKGVVRWIGLIESSLKVEVEFDNPVGGGTVGGLGEFSTANCQNALLVPPTALVRLSDYLMNSSKEKLQIQKKNSSSNKNNNNNNNNNSSNKNSNSNISNNNNNNNNNCYNNSLNTNNNLTTNIIINNNRNSGSNNSNNNKNINNKSASGSTSSSNSGSGGNIVNNNDTYCKYYEFCNDGKKDIDENHKKSKKISVVLDCLKHETNSCFSVVNREEVFGEKGLFKGGHQSEGTFEIESRPTSETSDFRELDERKISYKSSSHSVDNGLMHKETDLLLSAQIPKRDPRLNRSSHDLYDLAGQERERSHRAHFCTGKKLQISHGGGDDFNVYESSGAHPTERNPRTSYEKDAWSGSDESLAPCSGPSGLASLPEDLGKGSVVELSFRGEPHFGVIRWIGCLPDDAEDHPGPRGPVAGVEMEEEYPGFTDGTYKNKRYFQCNPKKALFVPLRECRKDSRFLDESQKQSSPKINYGQIDCPVVEGTIPPLNKKGDIESICGKNRGIQGHHNSCYLDATLFSMFAFTSVFDSLLYRPPTKNDIPQYGEVQRVLREEIVNPLRKNLYVRADRVMKLRTLLENLSSVSGLTSEEKDPEEFLNSLLAQILKAEPFLKLSSGQEAFHYQLFVEKDERLVLPSVQQLFEQSFLASDIKLKQVPSCLIIQMPRFGKSFKMYSRILPPQLLDITDIIENSPRQCTVCGKLAEYECRDCFGQQGIGNGLESISFCKTCLDTVHNHHCRSRHNYRELTVPVEFYELQEHCIIPRLYMELFAVVCIETSHYVAFVKCGSGSDAPWCFFDSMADRKGEQNGYNIPEMVPCPDLPFWLSEEGAKMLNEMRDERQLTEHAKRLFSDAYMCMYQSPDLMMYR